MGKKFIFLGLFLLCFSLVFTGCSSDNSPVKDDYNISGQIVDCWDEIGVKGVKLKFSDDFGTAETDSSGKWEKIGLEGKVTVTPVKEGWVFEPQQVEVDEGKKSIDFVGKTLKLLDVLSERSTKPGQKLTFTITAEDPDGDTITYSMSGLDDTGASLDSNDGDFSWTPTDDEVGTYEVTFTAQAGDKKQSKNTTIEVLDPTQNDSPPQIDPIEDKTIKIDEELSFAVTANDPDGDPITYSMSGLSGTGAALDSNTGEFSWIPTDSEAGTYEVTITAEANEKKLLKPL